MAWAKRVESRGSSVERKASVRHANNLVFIVQLAVGHRVEKRCRQDWRFTANEPETVETVSIESPMAAADKPLRAQNVLYTHFTPPQNEESPDFMGLKPRF